MRGRTVTSCDYPVESIIMCHCYGLQCIRMMAFVVYKDDGICSLTIKTMTFVV